MHIVISQKVSIFSRISSKAFIGLAGLPVIFSPEYLIFFRSLAPQQEPSLKTNLFLEVSVQITSFGSLFKCVPAGIHFPSLLPLFQFCFSFLQTAGIRPNCNSPRWPNCSNYQDSHGMGFKPIRLFYSPKFGPKGSQIVWGRQLRCHHGGGGLHGLGRGQVDTGRTALVVHRRWRNLT